MKVTFNKAKEIIAAHNNLIGTPYIMPNGTEMLVHEFRLLTNNTNREEEITYSIIALLKQPYCNNDIQFYAAFESIIAQLETHTTDCK